MKIVLPIYIDKIIRKLESWGHEAYIVGGCVRDSLLLRAPKDWDVTTSAKPEQIKEIFAKTVDTGIEHGTVTVIWKEEACEVTTYRIDGNYSDSRHPDEVIFSQELKEDIVRRDFTVNALAYHPDRGVVDLVGGRRDLSDGLIRCVGKAQERFKEDALRILRAWRFCAQLSFRMDPLTKAGIDEEKHRLKVVSVERIQIELMKIIESDHPDILIDMMEQGLFLYIIKECQVKSADSLWKENLRRQLLGSPKDKVLRLAILLDFIDDKSLLNQIFRRLHFDNETREGVVELLLAMKLKEVKSIYEYRKALNQFGWDSMKRRIDMMKVRGIHLDQIQREEHFLEDIKMNQDPIYLKDLAIGGKDLLEIGFKRGKHLGEILEALLDEVHKTPNINEKETLIKLVKERFTR